MKRSQLLVIWTVILLFCSFSNIVFALGDPKIQFLEGTFGGQDINNYPKNLPLINEPLYIGKRWSQKIVLDLYFPEKTFYFRAKVEALENIKVAGARISAFRIRAIAPTQTCFRFDLVILPGKIVEEMRNKLGSACTIYTNELIYWYDSLNKMIVKSVAKTLISVRLSDFKSSAPSQ